MPGFLKSIVIAPTLLQPVQPANSVTVSVEDGILGDARGGNPNRQISILFEQDWLEACAELGTILPWETRRANFLVNDVKNPKVIGAKITIGDVALVVTEETKPCQLMERAKPGLKRALDPDWRGGVCCRVLAGGQLVLGDNVEIEYPA